MRKTLFVFVSLGLFLGLAVFGPADAAGGGVAVMNQWQSHTAIQTGQSNTMTVQFANESDAAQTVLIDLELMDLSGAKVLQKFWDSQIFASQEIRTYELAVPADADLAPGTYYLSFGVFRPGWSGLEKWYHRILEFSYRSTTYEQMGVVVKESWQTASTLQQGQSNEFYARYHNYAAEPKTVLGDIELHDANGAKVAQVFADNATLAPGESSTGGIRSPDNLVPGTYYYSVGIFNPGWSGLLRWYHRLQEFTVQ